MTIRELRKKTGLTQGKFAECLGMPVGTLHNWEQGIRKPPEYILDWMEKYLLYKGVLGCSDAN